MDIQISGYDGSTKIGSLLKAFETINLGASLPALTTDLLSSASLEGNISSLDIFPKPELALIVLTTTGHGNNLTHVTVDLVNTFTAGLEITQIRSTVSAHGIQLGTIDTITNFTSAGNSTTTSPNLALDLNMDPQSLFTVTHSLAKQAGLDTAQLDGIVALGDYHYLDGSDTGSSNNRRDNIYTCVPSYERF